MNTLEWKIAARQLNMEKTDLMSEVVQSHPLQGVVDRPLNPSVSVSNSRTTSVPQPIILDPLSIALDGPDPLSQMLEDPSIATENVKQHIPVQGSLNNNSNTIVTVELALDSLQQHTWDQYRTELQANFSTTHLLTLTSSFLQATEEAASKPVPTHRRVIKTQNSVPDRSRTQGLTGSERIRARLEQLDSLDESGVAGSGGGLREYGGLTQEDFGQRIMGLKQELHNAWNTDQRVKALKICIQCVKLLSSPLPESFYPHKFMLVTDILDVLAQLVCQRLLSKSQSEVSRAEAQETARNWFYKVASIRELLPRLYLEIALLPCYNILSNQEGERALVRLTRMIRGIGDPILAAYAQMYLCRCGSQVYPQVSNYIRENIEDFLHSLKAGVSIDQESGPSSEEESLALLSRIFKPPLEWLMQCLAQRSPHHVLQSVIRACEGSEGLGQSLLLAGILSTFPCHFLAQQAITLTQLCAGCQHPNMSRGSLLTLLGEAVCVASPPAAQQLSLLNNVWKLVTRINNCHDYLQTAVPWLHYTAKHFTAAEVNKLLGDVLKHVRADTISDQPHYPALLKLITTALCNTSDAHLLFTMNNFLGLVSVFQRDSVSMGGWGVTRSVVEALLNYHPEIISDPNLVHHILTLAGALHDTINAMTTGDERRQLSMVLTNFIRRVSYGRDFEAQLDFYANCRASFSNLDTVMSVLVQCVCQLAMNTRSVVKGKHSSKTASFVRGCAAYCFITIPSVASAHVRQRLYLLSASTALLNNCMGQADACLKAAICEVPEILSPSFKRLDSDNNDNSPESIRLCILNLASSLLAAPDPPDASSPLYLLRGLVNAIRGQIDGKITDAQVMIEVSLLSVISAAGQENLPYSVNGVEGNDSIYGGDPAVLQEAEKMCTALLEDILTYIRSMNNGVHEKSAVNVCLALFWCVVTWADLSQQRIINLATFLWSQIFNHRDFQRKLVNDTKTWIVKRSQILNDPPLNQLCKACNS